MAKKSTIPKHCTKLDSLFSSNDDSFVEMGFTLLESLLTDSKIRQYYKNQLNVNDTGVVNEPSGFAESTRVRLLLLLIPYYKTLINSVTKLNLKNCKHKSIITPLLFKLTNLVELDLSLNWDEQDLDLPSLLESVELIEGLQNLRLNNWQNQQSIPPFFKNLHKVSFSNGTILPLPSNTEFADLPAVLQFMYVENCKNHRRVQNKTRFDALLKATDLFTKIKSLTISSNGSVQCRDDFYQKFDLSSAALYTLHKHKKQHLPNVLSIAIHSSHIDVLEAVPKVSDLTLWLENDVEKVSLKKLTDLQRLTTINFPSELHLHSELKQLQVYGSVNPFSLIQVGRKKYTDFYEGMSINGGKYGKRRWYYSSEDHPDIRELPKVTKRSIPFIGETLLNKMWDRKEATFWTSYLNFNKTKHNEILTKAQKGMDGTVGKWSKLGAFDFLWGLLVDSNAPGLPKHIFIESPAANSLKGNLNGVYIKIIDQRKLYLDHLNIQTLKLRGSGQILNCTLPNSITELNIERLRIQNLNFDGCKSNITSLTLVSIKKEDMPDLSTFPNLKTLKIIDCHLEALGSISTEIEHLNISFNPLQQFPTSILECTKIKVLEMASVSFTSVPDDIRKLNQIERISMTNSSLQDLQFLTYLPKLHTLKAGFCIEHKPWHHNYSRSRQAAIGTIPMLPTCMNSLRSLTVHDAFAISLGAYQDYTLEELNIQHAGEGTGMHLIKQFKHIKNLRGFLPSDTQPTVEPGVPTPVTEALPEYSRSARHSGNNIYWYRGYFTEMDPKFSKGLELYKSMLKK